jgi:hypothetical protein
VKVYCTFTEEIATGLIIGFFQHFVENFLLIRVKITNKNPVGFMGEKETGSEKLFGGH